MSANVYSQGICGDGAAILKDGQRMTVDEIVAELNGADLSQQDAVGYTNKRSLEFCIGDSPTFGMIWKEKSLLADIPLYTAPPSTAPEAVAIDGLHPAVVAFARAMQSKLDKNKHKDGKGWDRDADGARSGWAGCSKTFLFDKLNEEYGELQEEVFAPHKNLESIRNEAADIGNIAMMLADVSGALDYTSPPSTAPEIEEGSETKGMNLGERIAHVGGREKEGGYIEFGSVMAVEALVYHVLRDIDRPSQPTAQGVEEWIAEHAFMVQDTYGMKAIKLGDFRDFMDGMVKVPVEPTEKMLMAAIASVSNRKIPFLNDVQKVKAIYEAMLEAASKGE